MLITGLLLTGTLGFAQPTTPNPPARAGAPTDSRTEAALAGLNPSRPDDYLRVGERLIEDDATRAVGRETLALALLLTVDDRPSLAASAVVALAWVAPTEDERIGLWSLAIGLDPSRSDDRIWLPAGPTGASAADRLAARVLGGLRSNDPEALSLLGTRPDLRDRVVAEGERLRHDPVRVRAVLASWERNTADDPCRGRMTVRTREDGGFVQVPCPSPQFHHGVVIDEDWRMMVGIELSLLGSTPASWPAQAAVGLDAGVGVWTVDRVAVAYGVSPDRPVRRNGRWAPR
jgi:hypothetical protein